MKIRSTALYAYLLEAGVLNGTAAEIDRAKRAYRRLYKRQWKEAKRPRKEIRIECTTSEFAAIQEKAHECGQRHTTYARRVILSAVESNQPAADKDQLLKILQLVGMAAIATIKSSLPARKISELLEQAEAMLLRHLETQCKTYGNGKTNR